MPSWIEELAWAVSCPTCGANPAEPCRSLHHRPGTLEFNHPSRNRRFHLDQQGRRAAARRRHRVDSRQD